MHCVTTAMRRAFVTLSILLVMGISIEAGELSGSSELKQRQSTVKKRAAVYEPYIFRAASRYGVDPQILWTIAYLESGFNPRAVSRKGARGLMQFMPATARRYGLKNRHDPLSSIDAAARYVRDLSRQFGGRRDLILAAYNAGEYAVIRAGNKIPRYAETRQYVARGTSLMKSTAPALRQMRFAETARVEPLIKTGPACQSIYIAQTQEHSFQQPAPKSRPSATRSLYFNDR